MRIRVILPPNNGSHLLRSVADEVVSVDAYAKEYVPESSLRIEALVSQTALEKSDVK